MSTRAHRPRAGSVRDGDAGEVGRAAVTTQSRAAHDGSAAGYDDAARAAGWFPEAVFGLCFDRLRPGQRVLALGIGTGLCAAPFAAYGLTVWGLDESPGMLAVCRAHGVAERLVEHDLEVRPWPFEAQAVTHVLASGVVHFLADLDPFVAECRRVMSGDGVLALTTRLPSVDDVDVEERVVGGVPVYAHSAGRLAAALAGAGLVEDKRLDVVVGEGAARDTYRLTVASVA